MSQRLRVNKQAIKPKQPSPRSLAIDARAPPALASVSAALVKPKRR